MDYSLRDILQGQGSVCRLALLSERCNAMDNDLIVDFKASSAHHPGKSANGSPRYIAGEKGLLIFNFFGYSADLNVSL